MARIRKRFYLVRTRNTRRVVSLKSKVSNELGICECYITGPFRTFADACAAL